MCLISKSWGASGNRVWKQCSRSEFLRPVLEASPEPHTLLGLLGGCKWVGKKSGKFPGTYQKFPTMSQIFRKFPKNLGKFPKIPDFRSLFMILSPWQVYLLYKTLLSYRLSVVLNFCQIALNCSCSTWTYLRPQISSKPSTTGPDEPQQMTHRTLHHIGMLFCSPSAGKLDPALEQ